MVGGIAAQSTLGNMLAGLQLAFSDALRLDDVVVVEDESGPHRGADPHLCGAAPVGRAAAVPAGVLLHHQSLRELDAPRKPHPWQRVSPGGLVDPGEEVRTELYRALRNNPLWDQKDWTLQVTDITPEGLVELRALMSAARLGERLRPALRHPRAPGDLLRDSPREPPAPARRDPRHADERGRDRTGGFYGCQGAVDGRRSLLAPAMRAVARIDPAAIRLFASHGSSGRLPAPRCSNTLTGTSRSSV